MNPCSTPKASSSTLAKTARQLVVHDALDTTKSCAGSKVSSLTPITNVASASLAGAEMITRRAPALMCAAAFSRLVSRPVLSITTSMPNFLHGNSAGWGSMSMITAEEPTVIVSCSTDTGTGKCPWTESRASSRASASGSPRSFTAATSTSWGDLTAARRKARPVRPNPLIATLTAIEFSIGPPGPRGPFQFDGLTGTACAVVPKVPDKAL